jgi:hypothetical protein
MSCIYGLFWSIINTEIQLRKCSRKESIFNVFPKEKFNTQKCKVHNKWWRQNNSSYVMGPKNVVLKLSSIFQPYSFHNYCKLLYAKNRFYYQPYIAHNGCVVASISRLCPHFQILWDKKLSDMSKIQTAISDPQYPI